MAGRLAALLAALSFAFFRDALLVVFLVVLMATLLAAFFSVTMTPISVHHPITLGPSRLSSGFLGFLGVLWRVLGLSWGSLRVWMEFVVGL